MRFYMQQHPHYCGIDLHARTMYLCILNQSGAIVLHRNMPADPDSFLKAVDHLKWAFSEAAVLFLKGNPQGQAYLARLEKKHGKGKALTVLAHKLARAVYPILWRKEAFDMKRFLNR